MSIHKRPFDYEPEEYFDCGIAGEHPVLFKAWIDDQREGPSHVSILCVLIYPTISNPKGQVWDITEEIKKYPERLRAYEDEIRAHFENAKEKDWERDAI